MATNTIDVIKQGYARMRSRKMGWWFRRWLVLRRSLNKGPCRLEKYQDERSAHTGNYHKVVLMTAVSSIVRISSKIKKHALAIIFEDKSTRFIAYDSDLEADTWVKLLVQECLLPHPGLASGEPDILSSGIQKDLQEQFHVYAMPNAKLDVFGECLLQVTQENVYLWDINNPRVKLVAWPLTALRRYGSDPAKFTFEAGRQCSTGEGMFVFHTLDGEKIYRKVHQATLAIAETHNHHWRREAKRTAVISNLSEDSKGNTARQSSQTGSLHQVKSDTQRETMAKSLVSSNDKEERRWRRKHTEGSSKKSGINKVKCQ